MSMEITNNINTNLVRNVDMEITKDDYELIIRSLTCELSKVADALLYEANPLDEQRITRKYEQISNLFQQFYANSTKSTIVIQIKE